MPIDSSAYTVPNEPVRQVLPENYYVVEITDVTTQVVENKFKPEEPRQQLVVDLKVLDDGKYKDTEVRAWMDDSLLPQAKKKFPDATLPKLLKAVTGKVFTVADRAQVTPEFFNTLIGQKVRINAKPYTTAEGKERTQVVSFTQLET